jgi:hypothetical protein
MYLQRLDLCVGTEGVSVAREEIRRVQLEVFGYVTHAQRWVVLAPGNDRTAHHSECITVSPGTYLNILQSGKTILLIVE